MGYVKYLDSEGVFIKLPAGRTLSGVALQEGISLESIIKMNPQIEDPNCVRELTPVYIKKFIPENTTVQTTATTVQTTTAPTTMTTTVATTTAPEPVTEIEDGLNYQLNYPYAESWVLYKDEECTIPVRWMTLQEKIAFWAIPEKPEFYECYVSGPYPDFENPGKYYAIIYKGNEKKFKVYSW